MAARGDAPRGRLEHGSDMAVGTYMKRVSGMLNDMSAKARELRRAPSWDVLVEQAKTKQTFVRRVPAVQADGFLPSGIHDVDLGSFLLHVGTNEHRRALYAPIGQRMLQLRDRGVEEVLVAGSGIHGKADPGDVDALFHVADARRLPLAERAADWLAGTHWHGAERRHTALHTDWGTTRPTWLQYFSHRPTPQGRVPSAVIRVTLQEQPQATLGVRELRSAIPFAPEEMVPGRSFAG